MPQNTVTGLFFIAGRRGSPSSTRRRPAFPEPASTSAATAVSHRTFSPSPFPLWHAVAASPLSPDCVAACTHRRHDSGDHLVRASCPTCSLPRVAAVGATNAIPRPQQPRSQKQPNAGAASSSFLASSGRPRCCRKPPWMRASPSSPRVHSAGRLVAGDANPRLATAAGLAGVKPPVGLNHFDHGGTPPVSMTCGAGLLIRLGLVLTKY